MKRCKKCGEEKPLDQFRVCVFRSGNGGHRGKCNDCSNEERRAKANGSREKLREQTRIRVSRMRERLGEEYKRRRQEYRRILAEAKGKRYRTAQEMGRGKRLLCVACPECFRDDKPTKPSICAFRYWQEYKRLYATAEWKSVYNEEKRLRYNERSKAYFKEHYHDNIEHQRRRVREYKWSNPDKVKKWGDKRWQLIGENWDGTLTRKEVFNLLHEYKKCPYCDRALTDNNRHLDHMEPVTLGGMHSRHNVVVCCSDCNMAKSGKSFIQWITSMDDIRRQRLFKMFERKKKAIHVQLTFTNEWMASAKATVP